jgi:hypothetical protein
VHQIPEFVTQQLHVMLNAICLTLMQENPTAVSNSLASAIAEGGGNANAVNSALSQAFATSGGSSSALSQSVANAYSKVEYACNTAPVSLACIKMAWRVVDDIIYTC